MKTGQIEQLDRPANIYANPQTLFVADFIGVMNLLNGEQTGETIRLGDYTLTAPAHNGPVTVAIRPEDFTVANGAQPGAWQGHIEHMINLGHYQKALLQIPSLGTLKVYLPKATTVNEAAPISLSPQRFLVYRDGAAPVEVKLANTEQKLAV
jgi:putative spermidine/putrescine transport system ATP-binding protein